MKEIIELEQDVGYKYSFNHKSLIYLASGENYLGTDSNINEYNDKLFSLYNASYNEQKVQFVDLDPEMIQNAINFTTNIIFEVTEKCNLSCAYCALGDTYGEVSVNRCEDMDWQTARAILEFYIQKWKKRGLKKFCNISFYGGEPLLNMQLIKKIVSYAEKHGEELRFSYSMTTNGTLLHKHLKYLVEKDFHLAISLDGDRDMNSYRVYNNGREVYDDIFRNVKKIQKEYPDFFKERVGFFSVENSRNTDEGIKSFFNKEFSKRPSIIPLLPTAVVDFEKWNSMQRKEKVIIKEDRRSQYLSEYSRLFSGNFYKNYRSLLYEPRTIIRRPTGTCLPFSYRVFITVRKDIMACEKIGFKHTIGKVINDGVDIDFEGVAGFYNNIYNKFKRQCENCYKKESCEVCFLKDERYFEKNFKCEDFYPASRLKKCIGESVRALREKAIDFNEY